MPDRLHYFDISIIAYVALNTNCTIEKIANRKEFELQICMGG